MMRFSGIFRLLANSGCRLLGTTFSLIAFSLIACAPTAHALPESGGREGDFVVWGAGARALGLGKAYVALTRDATSSAWNPSGLALAERTEVGALHAALWEGATYDFIGGAYPVVGWGSFGMSATVLHVGGAERRDRFNEVLSGSISSLKEALTVSYAWHALPALALGLTVKHIGRWFDGEHSGFVTADLGFQWVAWKTFEHDLVIGGVLRHGVNARYGATQDGLPAVLNLGLAYSLSDFMTVAAELNVESRSGQLFDQARWRVGAETSVIGPLSLRAGLDGFELAGGAGLRFSDWSLDYSAGLHQDLGLSHRISTTWSLSAPVASQRREEARLAYQRALDLYQLWKWPSPNAPNINADDVKGALENVLRYERDHPAVERLLDQVTGGKR